MSPNLAADRLAKSQNRSGPPAAPPDPAPGIRSVTPFPGALLTHPMALISLGLLVLNDWVLKPSAGFRALGSGAGGWLTGKLSDAAGLVLGPLVIAAMLGTLAHWLGSPAARQRRNYTTAALAIAAIVVPFVACKISPAAAAQCAHALSLFGRPAHVVPDPTDLFMLPFAAVAWWVMQPTRRYKPSGN
ncbi:MAG: hypothetical protein KBG15_21450 [Kofleriaceae bacterium]|nr:hypothetical protein [Kofleriaceae bacterium]